MIKFILFPVAAILASIPSHAYAQTSSGDIPADFRGKIVYDGYMEGTVTVPGQRSQNFSLGGVLNQALNSRTVPVRGSYRVEIEYDKNLIRGFTRVSGADVNASGTFTGTRSGSICNFIAQDGLRSTNQCTLNNLVSVQDYKNPQGQRVKIRYEATQTGLVDYVERDKQEALASAERERANAIAVAEQNRRDAAEAAVIRALKPAPAILAVALEGAVAKDSHSWSFYHYDKGTIRNVKLRQIGKPNQPTIIRGEYTYNDGNRGWVEANVVGGKISCLHYHDRDQCSPVREIPPPTKIIPVSSRVCGNYYYGNAAGTQGEYKYECR